MSLPEELTEAEALVAGRIVRAQQFMGTVASQTRQAREDRDKAIAELRLMGWTLRRVGEFTGLSQAMLVKIDRAQGVVSTRGMKRAPKHQAAE